MEFGDDEAAEFLEHGGRDGGPDDEAVAAAGFEDVLHLVRDRGRRAGYHASGFASGGGIADSIVGGALLHALLDTGDPGIALRGGDGLGGLVLCEIGAQHGRVVGQHQVGVGQSVQH